jgi:hypothetical protein
VAVKETDFVAGKLNPSTDKILQELIQVRESDSLFKIMRIFG